MKIYFSHLSQSPAPIRLGFFLLTLLLIWLPIATPVYLWIGDPNLVTILTMMVLAVEFFLLLLLWGKLVHQQPQILQHYGLLRTRSNGVEILKGLTIGVFSILSLFIVQGLLGWLTWQKPNLLLSHLILEGLVVSVAVAWAEELFFRGWILDELERDYTFPVALWTNTTIFAVAHFIKPWSEILRTSPQFFGLILLGLMLVWAKRSCRGRLGLSIGLHGGLVWGYYIVNVGGLIKYSGQVPDWVTGINNNPLAGVIGLVFLLGLTLWMRQRAIKIVA